MKIIYKEDGKIDVERSIQGEIERLRDFDKTLDTSYRKPIKEIQAAIKDLEKSDLPLVTDELYALMDKLGEGSRGKIYRKTYELDENGEQIESSGQYKDLFEYDKYDLYIFKREGINLGTNSTLITAMQRIVMMWQKLLLGLLAGTK